MTPATEVTELSKPTDYQNKTEAYLPRITTALEQTFEASDLTFTPQNGAIEVKKHVGKVRDRYEKGNNVILITTDRLTGFDRPLAKIPFKGQVLNQVSQWWFDQTKDIMPNHVISVPHPNVTIATAVKPFMVEFVVRGYLTGSTKTSILPFYQSGGREFCGNTLEEGLLPHQKLPQNIITPTSKSDKHDESLTPKQIVELGLMTQEEWDICSKYALDLFAFAQRKAAEQGLILVDTKMEMGRAPDGRILLIDELFTPDSSRYWVDKDYAAALEAGTLPPKSLDKEFIRLWFKDNCDPYNDETLPTAPAELVADLSRRYIMLFEMITGTDFSFSNDLTPAAINASVQRALAPRSFLPSFKLKPDYKKLPVDREMYADPLGRYISNEMSHIFSDQVKFATWHRLWAALADSQRELGLPVTQPQVDELLSNADIIDFEEAARLEKELRHDVMAHNRAYGQQCPMARNIIHWGATSSFVTCNTEMAQIKEALTMIQSKVVLLLQALRSFAIEYKSLPTLGYTHLQPAQPVTVGLRAARWAYDLHMVLESISERIKKLPLRGVKGTVGTQATYMQMFNDDEDKVDQLDEMVCRKMGFEKISTITGQTYSRLFDVYVLDELKNLAGCLHKICLDIRLLAHDKEVEEPFEAKQIGSSAMAYKRNPMRSERVNGLARHIFALASEPIWTYANQMFERTLDDSAPRRIYIPQTFLTADAILTITINVVSGLQVWPEMISKRLQFELPFMATEQIIVACVKAGADRDAMHHLIRDHSMEVGFEIKSRGAPNNLFKRIRSDDRFPAEVRANLDAIVDPKKFIGRSAGLVDKFIRQDLDPLLEKVEGKSAASKRQFDLELRV